MDIRVRLATENDIDRIVTITHEFQLKTITGYREAFKTQVDQKR